MANSSRDELVTPKKVDSPKDDRYWVAPYNCAAMNM
jgi:hypothetical protein